MNAMKKWLRLGLTDKDDDGNDLDAKKNVLVGPCSFTPEIARRIADKILVLASEAEQNGL